MSKATDAADEGLSPRPPASLRDTSNPVVKLFRRCWRRVNVENEHFVLCLVGREGSGKSYTAASIANRLDPSFTHERILFGMRPLLERLRDGDFERGQFFVIDEAGVAMGNRTWQEKEQVKVNQALQLIRSHNLGLIFTLPRLGELDSQTQGRLHAYMEIKEKQDGEYVRGPWYWLDPDRGDWTGEIYHKKPRIEGARLEHIAVTPPPDDLVEPYEERKSEFQKEFYAEVLDGATDDENDDEGVAVAEVADSIETNEDLAPHLGWHGGHHKWTIDKESLRTSFDLKHAEAKQLKDLLRRRSDIDPQTAGEQYREGPA